MTDEVSDGASGLDEFRAEARAWLAANLERRPAGVRDGGEARGDEEVAAARPLQRKLFDGGYAGLSFPREYGGRGLTGHHERVFVEESRGYLTPHFGGAGHVTFTAIARSMLAHASPEFLRRHIPPILKGERLWCQFYSEPEAGSDLAGIRTTARREGDRWVLNGSKIWSTGAHQADYAMCLARTDWDVPKHRGLTWFAVPTDARGVTVRPIRQINGESGFCEAFLDDVVVSDEDIIGEVNQGWSVAQTMLVYERGAGSSGGARVEPRVLAPELVALARKVGRLDDPLARQAIARAHVNEFAQYHLGLRIAARLRSSATPQPAVAAYGKLAAGVLSPIRARLTVEIGGAEALTWPRGADETATQPATSYLNGRMVAIAAGTNEVQRNGIGERVLGLPREPSFDARKPFRDVVRDARTWDGRIG
ncbi:acyl-CoA dehydrogenase family protein [Frankia sp. CNm7]|uniref:Acyl-CoA dehydrogenase family protein n=1 Tax=Frankia nepalensis TaxID=1836974 RepID=A0A937RK90_9ACTN|nr:acyl-CoA dehydrogenase family protein [Frankia nepalensis]MBL7500240.1 acyl-CoA dehydrogenase family protein [Frankia nepalensis]MBL7514266.1 acyl-CoA dehydrogenase family protein [Frankia nepalensis]MBL7523769.1 acyl-CoA dehydrogenase family protein [Frankia nepalensis]MBL7631702.1 acyl-CoA dehydrogenase family protein [Frankia nepalensis]